ncbi:MAG: hypothetical protein IT462_07620 [Planctomycetes bacterium]|nr:hypothetical protein [Planctomycetota bacterium]
MDTVTYPESAVAELISQRFIELRLDVKEHASLVKQVRVNAIPLVIVARPDGEELHRFENFVPPADFVRRLQAIK